MSERALKDSNSWIYSSRQDLVLTAVVFGAALLFPTITPTKWGILEFSAVAVLIDQNHIFTTFFRIYFDPAEFKRRRRLYLIAPLVAGGAAVLTFSIDPSVFWITFAALSMFHFVRQQFGWFMITLRKNVAPLDATEIRLNKTLFYGLIVLPMIYGMSERSIGFYVISFKPELPTILATPTLTLYLIVLTSAAVYEVKKARSTGFLNWAKYNQYLVTFVISFLWHLVGRGMSPAPLMVAHGITYWYASYVMLHRNPNTLLPPLKSLIVGRWSLVSLFGLISTVTFLYWNAFQNVDTTQLFFGHFAYLAPIVGGVVTWTHYLLDAFIWKSSDNPAVREILYNATTAQT
ncbi:MAG: hypothetical protein IPJ84_16630 [Bdellovibrionales bacterium]|nr:hypothetical protein [Bdellovibrionales bacterium]